MSLPPPRISAVTDPREILEGSVVHQNTADEYVNIGCEKLKNILRDHQDKLVAHRAWEGPAGILATLIAALVVTDFNKTFYLDASTWKAMFILSSFYMCFKLIKTVIQAFGGRTSINEIIEQVQGVPHAAAKQPSLREAMVRLIDALTEKVKGAPT